MQQLGSGTWRDSSSKRVILDNGAEKIRCSLGNSV